MIPNETGFDRDKYPHLVRARKQIADAGTDLVIANDISKDNCHFGSDNNEVLIVDDEVITVPLASKNKIAKRIFDVISKKI